ncbi:cyclophane-forming radical SAM peptide maturase AmcB [Kitasatospora xanthocidica]|uniref:cyclophane-forming radical SAM peptide maturase AmcB n=1 Tax=Kitasatospora xanthocidica TaxID=83382 RepID=UPI001E509F55|nr:cyclophane-forming radical SAM peptide maturase AmcB [Kitasatospora xanthocidica]
MSIDSSRRSRARYRQRIASRPRSIVVQPDGFCNAACGYCYLPDKDRRAPMTIEVAEAVARSIAEFATADDPVDLVWHAGEPLTLGVPRFTELADPFEDLRQEGRLQHYVQTNGTLISDRWCEFFASREVRVGVSIDGPADCNTERVDRRGKPIFDRITRGIDHLRRHEIGFSALAVVTAAGIGRPEELLEFFAELGCHTVGFNIEESEGASTDRPTPTFEDATDFWRRAIAWTRSNPRLAVREIDRLGGYLRALRAGGGWRHVLIDPIPTISSAGEVVLLSPELSGVKAPRYQNFRAGNILELSLRRMLADAHQLRYVDEFPTGLDACEATCEFFDFCRGAQAGNRYFENGRFDTTETNYCRVSRQALLTALSDTVRTETTP